MSPYQNRHQHLTPDRLSTAAPGGPGRLRHPQPDRRGLRPHQQWGDPLCQRLLASLGAGMLVLCDRNLATNTLARRIAATHAHLLGRVKTDRKLPVLGHLADGSWLSVMGGVTVRVICAEITIATPPAAPPQATGWPPP